MLSPYGAAKIINAKLAELIEAGVKVDKYPLPGPMFYNYTSQKVARDEKPIIKWDATNGVDRDDLERWFKQYCEKKNYVVAAKDTEQESFDLSEAQ